MIKEMFPRQWNEEMLNFFSGDAISEDTHLKKN